MVALAGFAQDFKHPAGFSPLADLKFIKDKVSKGEQSWKNAFEDLKNSQWGVASYKPKPFSVVECGSFNRPNIGCNEIVYDGMAAYAHALQWYITGNKANANSNLNGLVQVMNGNRC